MAGFPLTRLLNREFIARVLREHEFTKAFENAQRDILELFKRNFPDAPRDGTTYGRRDGEWTRVTSGTQVDLGYEAAPDQGTVTNTGGTDAVLPQFTTDDAGLVPAPVTPGTTRYLREDQTWQVPPGGASNNVTPLAVQPSYWIDCTLPGSGTQGLSGYVKVVADTDPVAIWRSRAVYTPAAPRTAITIDSAGASSTRPLYRTSLFGSRSGLRFDGSDDLMTMGQYSSDAGGDSSIGGGAAAIQVLSLWQFMIVFVGSVRSAGAAAANPWQEDTIIGDTQGYFGLVASDAGAGFTLRGFMFTTVTQQVNTVVPYNTPFVATLRYLNGVLSMRIDGGTWQTVSISGDWAYSTQAIWIGGNNLGARRAAIDLAHVVTCHTVPPEDDITAIERYLGNTVGLSF